MIKRLKGLGLAIAFSVLAVPAQAADISGAGATFPAPVYAKWAEDYKKTTKIGLNYQAIGSGGGIKQIKAKTVDFGASDKPLKPEELNEAGLVQFPVVMGGVVPVINLPGVTAGRVRLTGDLLAKIYLGEIKNWNDPQIAALNKGIAIPPLPITVVHRSDGSGTSFLFTTYLSGANANWKAKVGASDAVQWPVGLGGKGNDGVAAFVRQTLGSIGYVEYAFAKTARMSYVLMENKAHKFVPPAASAFSAAAANADWANAPGYYLLLVDQPGEGSWPITGATFILMHKQQTNPAAAKGVLAFFDWAYKNGNQSAAALDYVPMPPKVKDMVRKSWGQIKDTGGKPVYTVK